VALGYREWNVYSLSAGGVLPLTAMRLYPEGIRSVILDSGVGNQFEMRGPDEWRGFSRTLEMVFAGCAANAACEAAYPNLRTRFFSSQRSNPKHCKECKDNGRTVRLPVAVVRTQSPTPAPDPIVYVTGGPNVNEIDVGVAQFFPSLPFAANRDFILYNQRGVGFSDPRLGCHEFDDIRAATYPGSSGPTGIPMPEQYLAAVGACRDRLLEQGIDLDAHNSAEDAADLCRAGRRKL